MKRIIVAKICFVLFLATNGIMSGQWNGLSPLWTNSNVGIGTQNPQSLFQTNVVCSPFKTEELVNPNITIMRKDKLFNIRNKHYILSHEGTFAEKDMSCQWGLPITNLLGESLTSEICFVTPNCDDGFDYTFNTNGYDKAFDFTYSDKNIKDLLLYKITQNLFKTLIKLEAPEISTNLLNLNGDLQIQNASLKIMNGSQTIWNFRPDGKLGIGVSNAEMTGPYFLWVKNGIMAERVKVAVKGTNDWSDKVFDEEYKLNSLEFVEKYIKENKHLPDIPSAEEVVKEGVDVQKMDALLLQKIEELTLYVIELKKEINNLKSRK
jgi:hypothetical protein